MGRALGGHGSPSLQHPLPNRGLLPQVGIILHYSSLSTLLWMAVKARVLYKEVTWKAPQQPDRDTSQAAPRPMLRYRPPFPLPRPHGGISRSWTGFALLDEPIPCSPAGSRCALTLPLPAGST